MIKMNVNALIQNGFNVVTLPDGDRPIKGVYIGDLLSWVMGTAKSGDAWITIMSNINVVAVASLADTACIILSEGVEVEDEVVKAAESKDINILSFSGSSYEAAIKLHSLL